MSHKDDLLRAAEIVAAAHLNPNIQALASRLRAAADKCVMVDRLAFDGFLSMLSVHLGKPTNRDKTPAEIIAMARAMLAAAPGGEDE